MTLSTIGGGQLQQTESNAVTFHLDLPGVNTSNIQIQYHQGTLSVRGLRYVPGSPKSEVHGEYSIDQSSLDVTQIKANLSDGVLTVTVPTKDKEEPKIVQVTNHGHPQITQPDEEREVTFSVDLPGVKAEDVKVECDKGLVTIVGERKVGSRVGSIFRKFQLSKTSLDSTALVANLSEGVLVVSAPKKEKEEPRTIEVTSFPHAYKDESKVLLQDKEETDCDETVKAGNKEKEKRTKEGTEIRVETVVAEEEEDKLEKEILIGAGEVMEELDVSKEEQATETRALADVGSDGWEEIE